MLVNRQQGYRPRKKRSKKNDQGAGSRLLICSSPDLLDFTLSIALPLCSVARVMDDESANTEPSLPFSPLQEVG